MIGIKKVTLEKIDIKEPRTVNIQGKDKQVWDVGIMVEGKWYNGGVWKQTHAEAFEKKVGEEVELNFYEQEGKGKHDGKTFYKFKFVSDKDRALVELTGRVKKLEDVVFAEQKTIRMDELPDAETPEGEQKQMDDLPW